MYSLFKFYGSGGAPKDRWGKGVLQPTPSVVFERSSFWGLLYSQLGRGGHYADVGCGAGGWVVFLHEQGFRVDGFDVDLNLVESLRRYYPDLKWEVGDVLNLPIESESYDGVLALGVLEYMEGHVDMAASELFRIVRPGGWVLVEVPLANYLRRLLYLPMKKMEFLFRALRGEKPTFLHYMFTRKQIIQELESVGFSIENIQAHDWVLRGHHAGLWIDWPFLRGGDKRKMNVLGRIVEYVCRAISPWVASVGVVVLARRPVY